MSLGCRALEQQEIKNILNYGYDPKSRFYHRNILMFVVQLTTGFRVAELLKIRIKDIYDVKLKKFRDSITIQRKDMKAKKKGRNCYINPLIHKYFQRYLDWRYKNIVINEDDYVFFSQKGGGKMNTWNAWQVFKKALTNAGISDIKDSTLGTHTMRKTFSLNFAKECGGDIFKLYEVLGHCSINSTVSYMRSTNEENKKVVKGLYKELEDLAEMAEEEILLEDKEENTDFR